MCRVFNRVCIFLAVKDNTGNGDVVVCCRRTCRAAIRRPELVSGARITIARLLSADISRTMASTPLVGISAIVITPSPIAVASDVKDIAGISDGFIERSIRASAANKGPTIISGFVTCIVYCRGGIRTGIKERYRQALRGALQDGCFD